MTGSAPYVTGPWRYERVEGAGHWLQLDAPDTVNALLLDFLSTSYAAAAESADWDRDALECPLGVPGIPRRVTG